MPRDPNDAAELRTALNAILTAADTYHINPALLYNTVEHHVIKYARPEQKQRIMHNMREAAKSKV